MILIKLLLNVKLARKINLHLGRYLVADRSSTDRFVDKIEVRSWVVLGFAKISLSV